MARRSDGLAKVSVDDLNSILVSKIDDDEVRKSIQAFVDNLQIGRTSIKSTVVSLISENK